MTFIKDKNSIAIYFTLDLKEVFIGGQVDLPGLQILVAVVQGNREPHCRRIIGERPGNRALFPIWLHDFRRADNQNLLALAGIRLRDGQNLPRFSDTGIVMDDPFRDIVFRAGNVHIVEHISFDKFYCRNPVPSAIMIAWQSTLGNRMR